MLNFTATEWGRLRPELYSVDLGYGIGLVATDVARITLFALWHRTSLGSILPALCVNEALPVSIGCSVCWASYCFISSFPTDGCTCVQLLNCHVVFVGPIQLMRQIETV